MLIACPHFQIRIRQRSKGQSAVAGAAYQAGEKLVSEYDNDHAQKDYRYKKPEVLHKEILLPPNAPSEFHDRQTLWNSVEMTEKQWNAQLSRGIVLALPRELPKEQYVALVRDYCMEQFVARGMCVDFAIHDPPGKDNPHAHIMLTMRVLDEKGKWLPKSRKVYDLDEDGNRIQLPSGEWKSHKENTVDWNDRGNAEIWRSSWAEIVNRYFDRNSVSERLDLRSYERQAVDQIPTVHLGPAVAQMEAQGIKTDIGNYNREVKAYNARVSKVRRFIAALESWLATVSEKVKALFAEKGKTPTIADLIEDYKKIRKAERISWAYGQRDAAIRDLQFTQSVFSYLDSLGIYKLDDIQYLLDTHKMVLDTISANENEMRKLDKTIEHIENYLRLKPIFDQSKKGFKKTQEKYAADHADELASFKKSARYLRVNNVNVDELKEYRRRRSELSEENKQHRASLDKLNLDAEKLRDVQKIVDTVLNYEGKIPDEKTSVIEKLESLKRQQQKSKSQSTKKPPVEAL